MRIIVICIILVLGSLSILVSCKMASNRINSSTYNAKQENTAVPTKVLEASISVENKDVTIITDIDKWKHSIKNLFSDTGLVKVEILKQKTYPIFYIKQNTVTDEDIINNYLSGIYSSILKENGYWDFEIKTMDGKTIKISGNKDTKEIKEIKFQDKIISIDKYNLEKQSIMEVLNARIVKKDILSNYYYFRSPFNQNKKPDLDEDFYYLRPFRYQLKKNSYIIQFGRKTDTKAVNYHAEVKDNKVILYYNVEGDEEAVNDFDEVRNLFATRYLMPDKNYKYYALKQSPIVFIYSVSVDNYDNLKKLYHLRLGRSTDTAQNFFLYDAENDKFYRDGATPEEIKNQNDVFIWVP